MSDLESDNTETGEQTQLAKVLESIETGASEAIDSGDYLSYSTLIDIYLTDASEKFSPDEKEQILAKLLQVLTESDDILTYEIGWDLPAVLLANINSDWEFQGSIRSAPYMYNILKIFGVLAGKGNPKELLLKCCELSSSIRSDDPAIESDDPLIREKFFDVKLFCIFQQIDSSLKRVETHYPSRFLSMAISAFTNLIYNNNSNSLSDLQFVLRRFYSFARDYTRLPIPKESAGFTEEELLKISKDEEYLQGKLLTSFVTNSIAICTIRNIYGLAIAHFEFIRDSTSNALPEKPQFIVDSSILGRFSELMLSFDVDAQSEFASFVAHSNSLFEGLDYSKPDDELSAEIFEKCVIDYQKTLAHSLTDSDAKEIRDSTIGILTMYTYTIASTRDYSNTPVSLYDAVVMTIRSTVPGMINEKLSHLGLYDICSFWSWNAIYNSKNLEVEISSIPNTLLTIYYQCMLYICMGSMPYNRSRYASLTFLTKLLAHSPESIAYPFIMDSLQNCPYNNVKAALVGILKELLTKHKSDLNGDDEASDLNFNSLAIGKSNTEQGLTSIKEVSEEVKDGKVAPVLPVRDAPKSKTYYTLTGSKLDDILTLVKSTVDETFSSDPDSLLSIDPRAFGTLTAYLNLLVAVKRNPTLVARQAELIELIDGIEAKTTLVKNKYEGEDKPFEFNAAGILEVAIDRIR